MTDNNRELTTDAIVPSEDANGGRTYTSGELARECSTTVRTIQFYDQKELLAPSGYSEGSRRLFGNGDADRLRFILLMKALGLKIVQIKGVLESPNREVILESILAERELQLRDDIAIGWSLPSGMSSTHSPSRVRAYSFDDDIRMTKGHTKCHLFAKR